ncbi:lanthionine synthetase C family protein [Nocardia iowensis]|uniref:Lanthionine synthetase C family protein n=1 Tax=Nocardia iowensis TaxID=204891 RepID=A0ABX8RF71_NOCIO|nr:lanthionine synthetase C family protein [Nocardia iowensis]QXN88259.1 lanthionine synthetase C family protein [Nocardia iowensis]
MESHAAGRAWRSVLPADLAASAIAMSTEVGERLCAAELAVPPHNAGRAVLFGQLDCSLPEQDWARRSHSHLTAAARTVEQTERGVLGLFGGLCEMAFAAHALSRDGTRYQRLLTGLDGAIATSAAALGRTVARAPAGLPFAAFDAISGLAGIGAYLLCRKDEPQAEAALRHVLTGLVGLCGESEGLPNWHTPASVMIPNTPMSRSYPTGVLNCGLAHGVPGPLAVLALAEMSGISVPGQRAAIERAARWLAAHRSDDEWGPNWPTGIPMPDATGAPPRAYGPTHNAWCYGSPGVARALWLAGTALADPELGALAVDSMTAVFRRPADVRRIDASPGLCHGVAGLLQITLRFAHDTGEAVFAAAAATLTSQLLAMFQPHRRFGYPALTENGTATDDPGLLDGAAGVALALLAAATDAPPEWDRTLLLA